jgi:hypothetical protein
MEMAEAAYATACQDYRDGIDGPNAANLRTVAESLGEICHAARKAYRLSAAETRDFVSIEEGI